ncbi:MAG: Stk1 family PASTA domain-containing Ser/Thr kinase [Actinomycetota bacterium]|nr:Stk1 family PASTA domain-containing Ser/Thr kinase [Actinomycetota bacterium]
MLKLDHTLSGRYRVEGLLGSGGMAQVYRGTDTVLSRTVAIKVLSSDYARDPAFVERFRREAQAAARLNHPTVVSVYDSGSDGGVHFIVMEFVAGRTLADVLAAEGPLPPERAAAISARVAEALSFAHEAGLVHRDVKPGNVMITEQGDVKVVDFGIARAASGQTVTQTTSILGTASYLSPEQAEGKPVDGRSDIYSLGIVLYELLTGRVPFTGSSPVAVAYRHVTEEPVPPSAVRPGVPPALEAITLRALAKDPAQRYQSAELMRSDLEAVARAGAAASATAVGEPDTERLDRDRTATLPPVVAPPTQPSPAGRPPARRRAWPFVLAAVAVLAIVALIVVGLLGGNGGPIRHASGGSPRPSGGGHHPSSPPAPATSSVQDAVVNLANVLSRGVSSGAISDKAAQDVLHHAADAVHDYQEGKLDDALKKLSDLAGKIAQAVQHGDISSAYAGQLTQAVQALATAMQAQPTPSGEITLPGEGD